MRGVTGTELVAEEQDAGIGVLGWLGFTVINVPAWGIIAVSSSVAWHVGFVVCALYTIVLVGGALFLARRGEKYRAFVNLLWVLGCLFIFVSGTYFAVNALGSSDWEPHLDVTHVISGVNSITAGPMSAHLPPESSAELKAWADDDDHFTRFQPDFATFQHAVYYAAQTRRPELLAKEQSNRVLWYFDGSGSFEVSPTLMEPQNLLTFKDRLFLSAEMVDTGRELFEIGDVGQNATLVIDVVPGKIGGHIHSLHVESDDELYFKASFSCPDGPWIHTIFRTNGTAEGTVDLRAGNCPTPEKNSTDNRPTSVGERKPTVQMWGMLLLGDVPMLAIASVVLATTKLPGVSLNIFAAIWIAASLLNTIMPHEPNHFEFNKGFATVYSSFCYGCLVALEVMVKEPRAWLEELKTWLLVPVSITFVVAIHAVLSIPFTDDFWRWAVYFALILLQVSASLILRRTIPMVWAAIGLFEVAWHVSNKLVELIFGDGSGEVATITMLAFLAFQGLGIILAAVLYASRRDRINGKLRELLRGSGSKLLPDDELEAS